MKPCSCGKFRHMCPSCKDAYFSECKQTIEKESLDSEVNCKTIDWTKPIYATECPVTAVSRTLPAKYHGKTFEGETIVEIAKGQYCGPIRADNKTPAGCWIIENIPEPKPEKWINVYWHHDLKKVIQSCMYPTYQEAMEGGINSSKEVNRLGTFQVN